MRIVLLTFYIHCFILIALTQPFHPDINKSEKTQVMVLATAHLAELFDDSFDPIWLSSLLDTLERFDPSVIGVEEVPPHILHYMEFDEHRYGFFTQMWPRRRIEMGRKVQDILGLSRPEAELYADSLLQQFDDNIIEPEDRFRLIQYFVAAYDRVNAALHWSYLPESYRKSNSIDELPESIVEYLKRFADSRNEIASIGIQLARRLGHTTIGSIDDHQDSDIIYEIFEEFSKKLRDHEEYHLFQQLYEEYREKEKRWIDEAKAEGDLYPLFKHWNSPDYLDLNMEQFKLYFRTNFSNQWDRRRMAQREVRDLNIASNIRRLSAYYPGERILVIIGASHKPFLDSYLSRLLDIEIVHLHNIQ